jgi:hypothetical protein
MPQFGTAAVSAAESQYKYGSSTYEMVLPFWNILWYRPNGRNGWCNLVTVRVWLLSVASVTTTTAEVSECQEKLYVYTRLPEIMDIDKVDERNQKLYHTSSGESIYPPSHVRTISEKMAISTLPRTDSNEVYYRQTIKLPFKCDRTPFKIGDWDGVQFKGYGVGAAVKELVVTLISAATPDVGRDAARLSTIDTISVSGRTQVPQVPTGMSVYSLRGSTGAARRVEPVVTDSVRRGTGTPATQNWIFDNFRQVLPTSLQQATPAYNQAVDNNFPTPPVRKSPPLPPPPPVVTQGSPRTSTPVAECIVGTEITAQYPEAQVQYQEARKTSTPSVKCASITKSVRGSTGRAVQVTQGQGSTPSVLGCGTIPGTKRFNECASYSSTGSSRRKSEIIKTGNFYLITKLVTLQRINLSFPNFYS